ncbi:flagellar biosynthesis anti-sigma factor FlgM [Pseudomonas sp. PSKL.D1]|uniref:flagellar biosynthesis anti-sigma factor FlgM n=1 Tax=Pseudomonas sp. PSKL.D1 TaxID=3029060 RepID=UPI0023814CD5|nr:flagellar biosynthesis anti-sigma factor FlgM [Pseudomonas sp. PSKL.D1]WDY57874.1 flagellar biosynthesis anti-sigma factor FlgM [Pseudomonas sp. PSKL.D1]
MKIISPQLTSIVSQADSDLAGNAPQRVAQQALDSLAEETVQISGISDLTDTDTAADVDLEKVAALRQSVADGSLKTDAQAIYTSLVADIREMAGGEPT